MSSWYPSFYKNCFNENISSSDTFKCILVDGYTFSPSHETLADVDSFEVSSSVEYTTGGKVTSVTLTTDNVVNKWRWSLPEWNPATFYASGAIIYQVGASDVLSYLVHYYDFGGSILAPSNKWSFDSDVSFPTESGPIQIDLSGITFNGEVTCIIENGKGGFFISGAFTSVTSPLGTFSRRFMCEINHLGQITTFNPISGNGQRIDHLVHDFENNLLYCAGSTNAAAGFTFFSGSGCHAIFRLNAETGARDAWSPATASTNTNFLSIQKIILDKVNNRLYACGNNWSTTYNFGGSTGTSGLICLTANPSNTTSTRVATFQPVTNGYVYDIYLDLPANMLYVCGDFTTINPNSTGNITRNRLARLDLTQTGASSVTAWNPNAGGTIRKIQKSGDFVYVCGSATALAGYTIRGVARISALVNTNNIDPNWIPLAGSGSWTNMFLTGQYLYLTGNITTLDSVTVNHICRIKTRSTSSFVDTTWLPVASGELAVTSTSSHHIIEYHDKIIIPTGSVSRTFTNKVFTASDRFVFLNKN